MIRGLESLRTIIMTVGAACTHISFVSQQSQRSHVSTRSPVTFHGGPSDMAGKVPADGRLVQAWSCLPGHPKYAKTFEEDYKLLP